MGWEFMHRNHGNIKMTQFIQTFGNYFYKYIFFLNLNVFFLNIGTQVKEMILFMLSFQDFVKMKGLTSFWVLPKLRV